MHLRERLKHRFKRAKDNVGGLFNQQGTSRPGTPSTLEQIDLPEESSNGSNRDANVSGTPPPPNPNLVSSPTGGQTHGGDNLLTRPHSIDGTEQNDTGTTVLSRRAVRAGPEESPINSSTPVNEVMGESPTSRQTDPMIPTQREIDDARPVKLPSPAAQVPQVTPHAASVKWKGVKELCRVLEPVTSVFGPIKEMVDMFVGCIDMYQMATAAQVEYDELQVQVARLLEDLAGHFTQGSPLTMTRSMQGICGSIKAELGGIQSRLGRDVGTRYLEAPDELEAILGCYRRIQLHLTRLSLNTNLEMWEVVEEQASGARSDRMSSLVDRLPSSLSACYNSVESAGLKRRACTPDTRVDVLALIEGWANSSGGGAVYWMNGMAGTGKTTIAYSVCDKLNAENRLAASFFCSRLRGECRNVGLIFPSIAYQLARFSLPFMSALSEILKGDPDVHTRLLSSQFEALIVKPLKKAGATLPNGLVVVIDALDECEDKDSTRQMLDLLLRDATSMPVKFIVSSRPEPDIREHMSERAKSRLVLHELDKGEVQADIKKYLREGLARMHPSDEQINALAEKAGVLFIYAATAVRYIGFKNFKHNPGGRLRNILNGSQGETTLENKEIDELYSTILEAAFGDPELEPSDITVMRRVLHAVVCAREPLTVNGLSELLQIHDVDRVRAALDPMWSVLYVVEPSELVTTLHASFPDFMFDPTRSRTRYCDLQAFNRQLSGYCFECIKQTQPQFNICGLDSSYLPDEGVEDIEKRVNGAISPELIYACRYWVDHVKAGNCASSSAKYILNFLSTKLLLWMEVLNLKKQMKTGIVCMKLTVEWCKALEERELVELAQDAKRFVETFASNPVSQSTPHIYISMLAFWPRSSPIAQHYLRYTRGPVRPEGTALDRRQLAHLSTWAYEEGVYAMAISPDGSCLALGIGNEAVIVDSSSGRKLLEPLRCSTRTVRSAAFSPDMARIFAGSIDGRDATVLGWDTRSGDTVLGPLQLSGHTSDIECLSFSPDCTRIATGSKDKTARLWDAETGKSLYCLSTEDTVYGTAFSPDGTYFAIGSCGTLHIRGTHTGDTVLGPLTHTVDFDLIAFTPDNSRIITAALNRNVLYVWNAQSGEMILGPIKGHTEIIRCIGCSPDGRYIVSGSDDRTVRVWDVQTGNIVLGPLQAHTGWITSVAFTPDGSRIISACSGGLVCTWDAQQRGLTPSSTNPPLDPITCVKFSSEGTRFVSGSSEGTISIWDAQAGEMRVGPIKTHTSEINAVDFLNDRVVSGADDGTICVCGALTGEVVLGPLQLDAGMIYAIRYSLDGQMIATGSKERVDVWNGQNGNRVLGPLTGLDGPVVSVQFSPDGTRIVASSRASSSTIAVWDVSTGKNVFGTLDGHRHYVHSVSYSPNGALIASGSIDGTIIVWDAYTGEKRLGPLAAHSDWVRSVHFSPDSTRLVSGSWDRRILIWDVETGEMVFELLNGHEAYITSVEYSPDGTRILSLSYDMSVRIHDARSPAERALSRSESEVGDWTMDKDGWVVDDQSRHLVWVPGDLRKALMWPRTQVVVTAQGHLRLTFDKSRMGESWADSFSSGM